MTHSFKEVFEVKKQEALEVLATDANNGHMTNAYLNEVDFCDTVLSKIGPALEDIQRKLHIEDDIDERKIMTIVNALYNPGITIH